MSISKQIEQIRLSIEAKNKNSNKSVDENHDVANNSVTKSHVLSRAYYRFGLVEKRCMEALISKLHPLRTDNDLQHIELSAKEYSKAYGVSEKHAYKHLESAGDSLVNRVITIEDPVAGVDRDKLTLMVRVRYLKKSGKVICTFNNLIVPHLIGLREKFSSYPLRKAVDFSSSYTWRFYEILVSWAQPKAKTGSQFMGWIDRQSVLELREMLGVPQSYSWSKLDKQVLEVAQKELKEKANIHVVFERIKTGRKITHLNIKFIEDEQQQLPLDGGTPTKK